MSTLTNKPFLMISSDCHASPLAARYRDYLEARYLDQLEVAVKEQEAQLQATLARMDKAASADNENMVQQSMARDFRTRVRYATELNSRLDPLAEDGFVGELVFPDISVGNGIPFTGPFFGGIGAAELDLYQAILRAYNRWLAETSAPDRQLGVGLVPLHDPAYAVEQIKGARALGLRGIMPEWDGFDPSFARLYDPELDPVWAACEEEDLPLTFHSFDGLPKDAVRGSDMSDATNVLGGADTAILITEYLFWSRRPLWHLTLGGALERHPGLKVGFVELFADWVPRTLAYLDFKWRAEIDIKDICPSPPSEYWRRQCFVGSTLLAVNEARQFADFTCGIETVTYGTDFPHPGSPWGVTKRALRASLGVARVSEDDTRMILGENLARIYGVDTDKLTPLVDEFGARPGEILGVSEGEDTTSGLDQFLVESINRPNTL
jgi:predicted TIM-barrel fold metal-dependent hydrolase